MTAKDLLVHVDQSPAARVRLATASALAGPAGALAGARITALALVPEPFMRATTSQIPAALIREHLGQATAEADALLDALRAEAAAGGLDLATRRLAGSVQQLPALFAQAARAADLAIVGQPDPETGGDDEQALVESAFLETGRPALMIPAAATAGPFRRILVAWDDSREAARALHDALPLLVAAEDVAVLVIDPEDAPAAHGADGDAEPGAEILAHLRRHGAPARVKLAASGRRRAGEAILAEAAEEAADLLVTGGFGRSRLSEALLGGPTRTLLADAATPILLSH